MYKSRVFSFNEENLLRDIANYERDTGKEVTKLQCNIKTYQVWVGLYRPELSYSVEIEEIGDGVMARYKGIPIVINEKLDDGIVGIRWVNNMNNDVLIVSYDKGYGNEIPIILVGRNTDKGMEIIKAFEREEANKVYEMLTKME